MNLKKIKILAVISIFLLSFVFHFVYDLVPGVITSLFFPVNESIWEHMKLIFTGTIFFSVIEYFLLRKYNITYHNYYFSLFVTSVISFIFYLIIYLPLYNYYGENMFISISLLLIVILVFQGISYYILEGKHIKYINIMSVILIISAFIIFIYFTYKPPAGYIFYDIVKGGYGIK